MKKLYTLLVLLTGAASFGQLSINQPAPNSVCTQQSDGFASFDLASGNAQVLGSLDPSLYSVAYYDSMASLQAGTGALPSLYTNTVAWHQVLYIEVHENASPANRGTTTVDLYVVYFPEVPEVTLALCRETLPADGTATFDLTSANPQLTGGCTSCTVTYYANGVAIVNPASYVSTSNPEAIPVIVTSAGGGQAYCTVSSTVTLQVVPGPAITSLDPLFYCDGLFDLTANAQINPYNYSFYTSYEDAVAGTNAWNVSQPYQGTHVFVRLSIPNANPGEPVCYTIIEQQLLSSNDFAVNLAINGQEVTVNATGSGHYRFVLDGNPPQASNVFENLSPGLHTIYVTDLQCSNEIAMQFEILPDAGTVINNLSKLSYHPNPVTDMLILTNEGVAITGLEVYNMLGQKVLQQRYSDMHAEANMAALKGGIYTVQVQAGNTVKTIKIVKK